MIAPYLRGFGPTRFLDEATLRSGQLAALTTDVLELTEALDLERFTLVGHDWGGAGRAGGGCTLSGAGRTARVLYRLRGRLE